ncbi:AraC family transcriptional regulator [Devosia sp. 1566]|uniref:AraC family transcriptional regulator n=1 Tax=Devosia sp. 1566 TaxID=2499144 RepID=UPI000FD9C2AD|nr:AraC family transcriptional regulator [Devosia sp. 1566]
MTQALLDAVARYANAHADSDGIAVTPIPGLTLIRATRPSALQYAVSKPLVALVVQGQKRVTMGNDVFDFGAGDSLVVTADVPTISQITEASVGRPYFSLVLDLERALLTELSVEMRLAPVADAAPIRTEPTHAEVADAARRLLHLLERPASIPVLKMLLLREMHYWLLAGRHGSAIRRLGWPDSNIQRIAKAVAVLRSDFAQPLPVEKLAAVAGMSLSSFHQHFRQVTSLSPLQFQKQLRLIEARRQMVAEGASASTAAYAVGYESVPQFTREYRRMFGMPPVRDVSATRMSA